MGCGLANRYESMGACAYDSTNRRAPLLRLVGVIAGRPLGIAKAGCGVTAKFVNAEEMLAASLYPVLLKLSTLLKPSIPEQSIGKALMEMATARVTHNVAVVLHHML